MDSEPDSFECPATDCPFVAQANDRDQLAAMVRKHVRDRHGRAIQADDLDFETRRA